MRLRVLASFGIVLGILLLASVAFAGYPDESVGLGNATVWVMNVHETLDANVVASFFDRDGYETDSEEATIDNLGNDSFPASSPDLESGWLGSVAIDSLRPIASIAETVWEDVPRGDYWSGAAFNDTAEGANEIFFPIIRKTGYHRSIFSLQCLDNDDCDIWMTYRDTNGTVVSGSPFQDTIQPWSQETYDLWDDSVNPNIPDDTQMVSSWAGSLQVTSTQSIAGATRTHSQPGYASAYNAVPRTTSTQLFFPSYRRRDFGSWGGQSDWSAISVYNLNSVPITIYLNFYDGDGEQILRLDDDLAAHGSRTYNSKYTSDPEWSFEDLGTSFNGSAVVTSTYPIVGSCRLVRAPSSKLAAAYQGFSGGYDKLVFPVGYRVKEGSAWRQYTSLQVQNLDPENEITVNLQWILPNGTVEVEFDDDIPAYASHGYNTKYGAGTYDDLGVDWKGTIVVTTTSPVGIGAVILNLSTMAGYQYISHYDGIPAE